MEKNRRTVAEEAAAKTKEAMEQVRRGKMAPFDQPELEDRPPQMALPKHAEEAKSLMKEHPLEAALGALSLGFLLTRFLPIKGLLRGALKLGWTVAKPMALVYFGGKLARFGRGELRDRQNRSS